MFPQKLREDPLLLDKLRRQLSSDLSVLSAQLRRRQPGFALLQNRDDLLLAVSCAFHDSSPLLGWENSHFRWSSFRGLGQIQRLTPG